MSPMDHQRSHAKTIILVLFIVGLFTASVIHWGIMRSAPVKKPPSEIKINGTVLPEASPIEHFNLTDQYNMPFTNKNLQGKWTLLFFGFTNCGYVCPTTLTELRKMYQLLQQELPEKLMPQVVMVSVDPERDSVVKMRDYMAVFDPHFVGVRAGLKETEQFEQMLHIAAVKVQAKGQDKDHYMINHTAEILLIAPSGGVVAYFAYPHEGQQMAKDYKLVVQSLN